MVWISFFMLFSILQILRNEYVQSLKKKSKAEYWVINEAALMWVTFV